MRLDWSTFKFRCHNLYVLATEARDKTKKEAGELGDTAKSELVKIFVQENFGRKHDINSTYLEKGIAVEEDAITLVSLLHGQFYIKNENTYDNEWITGTPDLIIGDCVKDIKSSFDIFSHFAKTGDKISKPYYWQLQGYMSLTGSVSGQLYNVLINTPKHILEKEIKRLEWQVGPNELYEAKQELEKLHVFDDIPLSQRIIEGYIILRNDEDIEKIPGMVKKGRDFLQKLSDMHNPKRTTITLI